VSSPSQTPIRVQIAALVLALSVCVPAVGQAGRRHVAPGDVPVLSNIDIENFGRVNANYFRGSEPDDDEYANLASFGIKTVVDLRSNDVDPEDRLLVERAGMTYVQIPMTTHEPPTREVIDRFLQIVNEPENQPVYVHCVGGRHRTGVMTAIYRMTNEGWTADQAFKEMKVYRFGADFLHPEFKRFVYSYQPDRSLVAKITAQ
jgi:protein tyrosine/serine phosphatase